MEVSTRERARRLAQLALHDPETGLLNRLGLELALIDAIRATSGPLAFAALALVPDAELGERMKQAGARLARQQPDWLVGRFSPDSLGVIMPGGDEALWRTRLDAAQAGLAGQNVATRCGLAAFPDHADEAIALMTQADIALGHARAGPALLAVYDKSGRHAEDEKLMADLIAGLGRGEVTLLHQPKLDLRSGRISSAEALVRWRHPVRGQVSPDLFVPVAEGTGAIRHLTDWTLAQAAADARVLADAGRDIVIAANISASLLGDSDFAVRAVELARGARLCFEITETAVIENPELAARALAAFTQAGIEISIDDFGVRLSSFDYLETLAAKELKIDKSFVAALIAGARGEELMRGAIDLGHELGLIVTVEGVETQAVLDRLQALGADRAQGNLIAPPLSLGALTSFLDRKSY
jgi:EAL domain-containing protein (putative c-di-GMP-specific phosphodiesterase class I)